MSEHKCYLGDGVYVDVDGYEGLVPTAESGQYVQHEMSLEVGVYVLMQWVEHMKRQSADAAGGE